ncbi:hypothetical protein KM043_007875 [Ampulex compressa]|nr:hypothetical protein KM043_007875 [Ampulex compressa]
MSHQGISIGLRMLRDFRGHLGNVPDGIFRRPPPRQDRWILIPSQTVAHGGAIEIYHPSDFCSDVFERCFHGRQLGQLAISIPNSKSTHMWRPKHTPKTRASNLNREALKILIGADPQFHIPDDTFREASRGTD